MFMDFNCLYSVEAQFFIVCVEYSSAVMFNVAKGKKKVIRKCVRQFASATLGS